MGFKKYLFEEEGIGLTVFDIDDTLFHTSAKIGIVKNGKIVKKLTNQQYNNYKLKAGESWDFSEFKDAKIFRETSKPIIKMINKAKTILSNSEKNGSKVILMTARANFDDKETFLQTFRDHNLDIDKIYVERSGNLGAHNSSAKNKRMLFHKYLRGGKYSRVRFFDDAQSNITMFKALAKRYPNIKFEAYLVGPDGSVKKV